MKEVVKKLPRYQYLYFADNARSPYGARSKEVIYDFTRQGVKYLFKKGARLVILACNTSSANALRRLQREYLPEHYPDRRILGIIIPTAEEAGVFSKMGRIGILATEATVKSGAYLKEIKKRFPKLRVYQQSAPLLVPIIEAGEENWSGLDLAIKKYLTRLLRQDKKIDALLLGCTHYGLIGRKIRKYLPKKIKMISQGKIAARKLVDYLKRHPEIESRVKREKNIEFYSTEMSERVDNLSRKFFGKKINIRKINGYF